MNQPFFLAQTVRQTVTVAHCQTVRIQTHRLSKCCVHRKAIASLYIFCQNITCLVLVYEGCAKFYSASRKTVCRWATACCCLMIYTVLSEIEPSLQWVPAVLTPGVKWPGREAFHSPLSSAGFQNEWSCTYAFPYACMACTVTANLHLG